MKERHFKFKLIKGDESIILTLNCSELSINTIHKLTDNPIKLEAGKECKL